MVEMLKQVQHDTLNFSIILMKKHCCIILSLLLPLLFTSCLADLLNEKFGYTAPIYVSYKSQYGDVPDRKLIEKGGALTSDYLPVMYYSGNEFEGWFLDDNFSNLAQEGYIVNKSITLYAKWKYGKSKYQAPVYSYEVHFCFFDADNSSRGFEYRSEYTQTFDSREVAESLAYSFAGYEYIPGADTTYSSYDSYTDGQLTKQITIIEKKYYKTHIYADSFKDTYYYLSSYPDFNYTFYITDYAPNLASLTDYAVPSNIILNLENCYGLTEIPSSAFENKAWLKEIYLPSSIGKIDTEAFYSCINLETVSLRDGITEIGDYAFYICNALNTINLPDSITTIGDYAFQGCYSLTEIILPPSIDTINKSSFAYCTSIGTIKIPSSVSLIRQQAFMGCTSLKNVYLPLSLNEIEAAAFSSCGNLTNIFYAGAATDRGNITILDSTLSQTTIHWEYTVNY